jgi:hypothetical protein
VARCSGTIALSNWQMVQTAIIAARGVLRPPRWLMMPQHICTLARPDSDVPISMFIVG